MKSLVAIVVSSLLLSNVAFAQTCAEKALSKDGKPLAGAAKNAYIKKCEKDGAGAPGGGMHADSAEHKVCADKALSKDGKPLAGAAKSAYMKKCMSEAK